MKKTYESPKADSLVFKPTESLAIDFDSIFNVSDNYGESDDAATSVGTDIKINVGN